MTSIRIRTAVAAAVALPLAVATAPADAGSSYLSRTTGRVAVTDWVQVLDLTSRGFGDVHVGWLSAYETAPGRADVFAYIDDWDCPPGELPTSGGHGEPGNCVYVGARQMEGSGISFTISGKLSSAHLEGALTASTVGHEGPGDALGTVSANFDWVGAGDVDRSTSTFRYRDGTAYYSETYRSSRRSATMRGVLGPMLFEQAASATGSIEEFRVKSQSRER